MANSLIPLDTLAGTIKAHIAAGDKAFGKAEEHYKAAGIHLKEARDQVKKEGMTFSAFLVGQCNIGRSRAYELIAIADGTTTLADLREKDAAKKRAARADKRPGRPGQSADTPQQDQLSPDDTPLRLPSDDEMKRIYDDAPTEVKSVVDGYLSLTRKDRDTAWQLINLYDQPGAPSPVEDGRSEIAEEPKAIGLIFQIHEIKEKYADLLDLAGDMMESIEDMYEDANPRQQKHWEKFCPLIEKVGSDAQKRIDLAWPMDKDGDYIETDYVEPDRDELVDQLLEDYNRGRFAQSAPVAAKADPPDKAALAALRKRAQALGYKTIHRRGNDYHLVNLNGERGAGGVGRDRMEATLDYMEAFEAGAVQVFTTACGKPMSACDKNGPIGLEDPRAVEAFSRLAHRQSGDAARLDPSSP